jgi:hypothetical protein
MRGRAGAFKPLRFATSTGTGNSSARYCVMQTYSKSPTGACESSSIQIIEVARRPRLAAGNRTEKRRMRDAAPAQFRLAAAQNGNHGVPAAAEPKVRFSALEGFCRTDPITHGTQPPGEKCPGANPHRGAQHRRSRQFLSLGNAAAIRDQRKLDGSRLITEGSVTDGWDRAARQGPMRLLRSTAHGLRVPCAPPV